MAEEIKFNYEQIRDDPHYHWVNIEVGGNRVGKARVKREYSRIIIKTINIFQEFEKRGYAKMFVGELKNRFREIIADKVRPGARTFWQHLDFKDNLDGNYRWVRKKK